MYLQCFDLIPETFRCRFTDRCDKVISHHTILTFNVDCLKSVSKKVKLCHHRLTACPSYHKRDRISVNILPLLCLLQLLSLCTFNTRLSSLLSENRSACREHHCSCCHRCRREREYICRIACLHRFCCRAICRLSFSCG